MPDDEDFSEIDTTAAEFDAMWNEAEPAEMSVLRCRSFVRVVLALSPHFNPRCCR
jgi:hypothetical protein